MRYLDGMKEMMSLVLQSFVMPSMLCRSVSKLMLLIVIGRISPMALRLTLIHHDGIVSWPNDNEVRPVVAVDLYKSMESDYIVIYGTLDIENISGLLKM